MPVTNVLANDHQPYSMSTGDAPESVAQAARSGFGLNIFDLDIREISWHDESFSSTKVHIGGRPKVVRR
jgi:hypothetical protein